jgi:hypothetical protein
MIKVLRALINRILGRKRLSDATVEESPILGLMEKRADILENALIRCGVSRRSAKRITIRIFAENPDFDLFSPRFSGVRYALQAIAEDFQNAFEFLLEESEEAAYDWLHKVYQGTVVFVPALFYDF